MISGRYEEEREFKRVARGTTSRRYKGISTFLLRRSLTLELTLEIVRKQSVTANDVYAKETNSAGSMERANSTRKFYMTSVRKTYWK
jgi:hypothetical protein